MSVVREGIIYESLKPETVIEGDVIPSSGRAPTRSRGSRGARHLHARTECRRECRSEREGRRSQPIFGVSDRSAQRS